MSKHNWLIRPSQLGLLMTKGRGTEFGETSMELIRECARFYKYGIEPETVTSKYLEKGILNERDGMELAKDVFKWDIDIDAPKHRITNDYLTGEPDVNQSILADIKCSFMAKSFHKVFFDDDVKNKSYLFQMNAYMFLTGHDQCELVYCLTNTPEHIIADEIQKTTYKLLKQPKYTEMGMEDAFSVAETDAEQIIFSQHRFGKIPKEKRVKRFIVKRDDVIIEQICDRIDKAREMFDQIYKAI
jgi:hypothetical protein